ncbi:MAG TPA: hypothetical protein VGC41_28215 [Kofleriaceae bacterium]
MKRLFSIIGLALVLVACERSGAEPKGSGALSPEDKQLFALLPAGSTAVFGGNYMKLQQFMSSTLGKSTAAMMEKVGPGLQEWTNCFTEKPVRLAGSGNVAGKGFEMRMVFSGYSIEQIGKCAARANMKATVDPDGKFIAVDLPPPTNTTGYLLTSTGAIYTRQQMIISAAPTVTPASRSDLENDLKTAVAKNVIADDRLLALIGKADRTKTVWFVGTGANTPIADKLGELVATLDLTNGLAMDLSFQLLDPSLVTKFDEGITEMKKMSGSLPPSLKNAIESIAFSHSGDRVRLAMKLDDKQLADVIQQASMLGGN